MELQNAVQRFPYKTSCEIKKEVCLGEVEKGAGVIDTLKQVPRWSRLLQMIATSRTHVREDTHAVVCEYVAGLLENVPRAWFF
jgi:hypothetical protein